MTYAQRIKQLREDHDYSQAKIAKELNVAQTTYSNYETGSVRIPVDTIIILAEFYDVDLNYILGVSQQKNTFPKK